MTADTPDSRLPIERVAIGSVQKNARESVQVELRRMPDGRWRAALVMAFRTSPDTPERPGRGGLTLPIDALPELAAVIAAAVGEARDRALVE